MKTNNQKEIDLIEQFIDKTLSIEEENDFLDRLKMDKEFSELYNFRLKIKEDLQKAKQYEKTGKFVVGTIKHIQRKKRRNTIYAIAAGLALLIAIPGIFSLVNRQESNNFAETDSIASELFEPQIDQPESYANDGVYVPDVLTLEKNILKDSAILHWEPALPDESMLIVLKLSDESELIKTIIPANQQRLALSKSDLPVGKLVWFIVGFNERDTFEIAN